MLSYHSLRTIIMKKNKLRDPLPYILVAPAILLLLGFMLYPMVSNVITSLFRYKLTSTKRPFVGLENYSLVLNDERVWQALGRTIVWTAITLVIVTVLGVLMAMLLKTKFPGSGFLKAFMLIPWILPSVITGYIWQLMLAEDAGIITYALKSLNIVSKDFSWFVSGSTAMSAAIMANSWRAFPFLALMVFARLSNQPKDLIEAASIDGASRLQVFWNITIPHIKPVLNSCILLIFIWTFNAYDILRVMTNGGPAEKTTTMSILVYKEAFSFYNISTAATMSVLMFSVMLTIIIVVRLIRKVLKVDGEDDV